MLGIVYHLAIHLITDSCFVRFKHKLLSYIPSSHERTSSRDANCHFSPTEQKSDYSEAAIPEHLIPLPRVLVADQYLSES